MSEVAFTSPNSKAKILAAWPAALRLQQFGYQEISNEITGSMELATYIVKGWIKAGKVRVINPERKGGCGRLMFEVLPEHEVKPMAVPGDSYEQMWTTMRKTGAFSPLDLKVLCSVPVTLEEASAYCRMLLTSGYLRVAQKALPPHKTAIYRLIKATGPRAPRHRRVSCVVDPNLGTTLPLAEVGA